MKQPLILIRHSITRQEPGISSHHWMLTDDGLARCKTLAEKLIPCGIDRILSSHEPKAMLTAQGITAELELTQPMACDGFEETHRHTVPYSPTVAEFEAKIHAAMQHPDELLFGEETFNAACDRFESTVETVGELWQDETLAIVTHGTILSLYVARVTGIDVFKFWQSLGMPACVALNLPEKRLIDSLTVLNIG